MITRRRIIRLAAGMPFLRGWIAGARPTPENVDRLAANAQPGTAAAHVRRYGVSATITLLGIRLVSKSGVGGGYVLVEEAAATHGQVLGLRFAAGSFPESARGLNRVGYIEEVVLDDASGAPAECAYFGFMTTSSEKNLDEARKALEASGGETPYSATCGNGSNGRFTSRVTRVDQPSGLGWRDLDELVRCVKSASAAELGGEPSETSTGNGGAVPATFLYAVRKAIASDGAETEQTIIWNGKQYRMKTTREPDSSMGARLAERKLARADRVMRLNATLRDCRTGHNSPFTVWFEPGGDCAPPLRFEYQARSFLRLAFEAGAAEGPAITSFFIKRAFHKKEENV